MRIRMRNENEEWGFLTMHVIAIYFHVLILIPCSSVPYSEIQ